MQNKEKPQMNVNKKIKQSCIISLVLIAAELIFSIILKSKALPSDIVIGASGSQSLVYFIPQAAGIALLVIMAFSSFMVNASFKAFAKGSFVKWLAFFGAWLLHTAVCIQSAVKISTMEMFSFENNILRIVQFAVIVFAVISCAVIRRMKIS